MKLSRSLAAALVLLAAASSLSLTSCKTLEKAEDRPSNVISTSPNPQTALSGVTAGTVERQAENIGAGQ